MKSRARTYLMPVIGTVVIIALMTGVSEYLGDREIIFPEIAALAVGFLCAPKRTWQVDSRRMFLLITGCAVCGLVISTSMPGPAVIKIITAFALAQIVFMFSGTSLAPLISAVVLPVLIGTDSWSYVISAAGMTLLIIIFHKLLVKSGIRSEEPFVKKESPDTGSAKRFAFRTVFFALMLVPAYHFGWIFAVAPPLLVAFTEWTEARGHVSGGERKVLIIAACALIGAGCRLLMTVTLGMPLAASAAAAALIAVTLMIMTGMFVPPAGALTMLAMLIPESSLILYPAEAAAGAVILYLAALAEKQFALRGTEVPETAGPQFTRADTQQRA